MSEGLQLAKAEEFWLNGLKEAVLIKTDLFLERDDALGGKTNARTYLNITDVEKVAALCNDSEELKYIFYATALAILIHKYDRSGRFAFCSPVAQFGELAPAAGYFYHTFDITGEATFKEIFAAAKAEILENIDFPLGKKQLSELLPDHKNLLNFSLVINNHPDTNEDHISPVRFSINTSDAPYFEVTLEKTSYAPDLTDLFADNFKKILSNLLDDLHKSVFKIDFQGDKEKEVKRMFAANRETFSLNKDLITYIEENAIKNPENTAVICGNEAISYADLSTSTDQIARYLTHHFEVGKDKLFGVMMERSINMIQTIYAIWKTGSAYVPIGTDLPDQHIRDILEDSGLKTVMIESDQAAEQLKRIDPQLNVVFGKEMIMPVNDSELPFIPQIYEDGLSYVIYTSGSTGKPKGVMIEHGGMLNHIGSKISEMKITADSIVAQNAPHTFDISVWQFFSPLVAGGTCFIYPKNVVLDVEEFILQLIRNKVTVLELVPSYLLEMLYYFESGIDESKELKLEILILNAETLIKSMVKRWLDLYPSIPIVNTYGATEASDDICHHIMSEVPDSYTVPVMNRPIQGFEVHIVDENWIPVPVGSGGEILLAGPFVGRGYVDQERSKQSFFSGPIEGLTNQKRIYKTGDYGRFIPSGHMEFLGRKDNQVKIRGHRIELGAIENAIGRVEGVKDCKAIAFIDRQLIAVYYLAETELEKSLLDQAVSSCLPIYMLPSAYIFMEKFPLTNNGKVDRKKLPDPESIVHNRQIIAPTSHLEFILTEIWKQVLRVPEVSIDDNFYDLGGDSIKSLQVVSRLKQKGYKLKVDHLLRHPVLAELVSYIADAKFAVDQSEVIGEVQFTPIQHWFFSEQLAKPNHYCQAVLLSASDLNGILLQKSIDRLIDHHDLLRMILVDDENGRKQIIRPVQQVSCTVKEYDLRNSESPEIAIDQIGDRLREEINLIGGQLINVAAIRLNDGYRIGIVCHHLITDGISWRILLEDIEKLYVAFANNESPILPLKTSSFKDWAKALEGYAQTEEFDKEIAYWKQIQAIQTDKFPLLASDGIAGRIKHSFVLDSSHTESLVSKVHNVYSTDINEILITALAKAVNKILGVKSFLLEMERHGRQDMFEAIDISRTVGWFTVTYPHLVNTEADTLENLIRIKESLRRVPEGGIGYGIARYLRNLPEIECNPAIHLNYLGDFTNSEQGEKSVFQLSDESFGLELAEGNETRIPLEITGIKLNEKLFIRLECSARNDAEILKELCDGFHEELVQLIDQLIQMPHHKTPVDLTEDQLTLSEIATLEVKGELEDVYEMAPMQKGMFYHWLKDPKNSVYTEQASYRLTSKAITLDMLREAYDYLVQRHSILRTSFSNEIGGKLLQIVYKNAKSQFVEIQLDSNQQSDKDEIIAAIAKDDREKGFDLTSGSQMRLTVIDLGHNEYHFIWCNHHILIDGWCLGILISEFTQILDAIYNKVPIQLPAPKKYVNYIQWLKGVDKHKTNEFWKSYLNGYDTPVSVPGRLPVNEQKQQFVECIEKLVYTGEHYRQILRFCGEAGTTVNTFVQSVWGYVLSKYNRTSDVVFGAVVSGRPPELSGVEDMVGLFINTIPVRIQMDEEKTPLDLVKALHETNLEATYHHFQSLNEILQQSTLKNELFDHIMIFENFPMESQIQSESAAESEKGVDIVVDQISFYEETNYDFLLVGIPLAEGLQLELRYNTSHYDSTVLEGLKNLTDHIIKQFVNNPNGKMRELELCYDIETILSFEHGNTNHLPEETTLFIEQFEKQCRYNGQKTAIIAGNTRISYAELNDHAEKLASALFESGVRSGDRVRISLKRNEQLLIAIIAVLKLGAAYIPVSVDTPPQRLERMQTDCSWKICIDEEYMIHAMNLNQKNRYERLLTGESCMYIMYTSGTTGEPKGVVVLNENFSNLMDSLKGIFNVDDLENYAVITNFTFDISILEMLGPLYFGKTLVVFSEEESADPQTLDLKLRHHRVNWMQTTPSRLKQMGTDFLTNLPETLAVLMVGGEALPQHQFNRIKQLESTRFYNMYGPTETTIWSSFSQLNAKEKLTIGRPLKNESFYIVDHVGRRVPVGLSGELWIGGAGVSNGYLNKTELTNRSFISNPFGDGIIYKTGDLSRWLPNGEVEFIGREDNQLKIRGYRIESEDIEEQLKQIESIEHAFVLSFSVKEEKQLIAFYKSEREIPVFEIKKFLKNFLPAYMIPQYYVRIDKIPLTSNAKLDKNALLSITGEAKFEQNVFVEPKTPIQIRLAGIVENLLQLSQVGLADDFFALGGDSIQAIQLINAISSEFGVKIGLNHLFENQTVEKLSVLIEEFLTVFSSDIIEDDDHEKITI